MDSSSYTIAPVADLARVRQFLLRDADYCAYALGDLEPPYSAQATWYGARGTDELEALALLYEGLTPPILFLPGAESAVSALLSHPIGPERVYATTRPEMRTVLETHYRVEHREHLFRMRLFPGQFTPIDRAQMDLNAPRRLTLAEAPDAQRLIDECALHDGRDWGDIAFSSEMLTDGYYYGVADSDRLIALGGTHIIGRQGSVAAIGNIVTHPGFRRLGLGGQVASAVTGALVADGFETIVLNVNQKNEVALKLYQKLGFSVRSAFEEAVCLRL